MNYIDQTIEFIRKTFNQPNGFIPLHVPTFRGNEKKYLEECIDSTFVSSVGKFVDQFEEKVQEYTGVKKAIVCVNGTNAIHVSLRLVGVETDDEVITQPLTFIATTNAIVYAGAIPVFVDVDKDTMGLSPIALEQFLFKNTEIRDGQCYNTTTNRRIKACLPMHTFGHACRINEIATICERYHIELVEDAAESMGSRLNNQSLGRTGKVSAISFNGNKIMTTGGGGIIITDNETLGDFAKHLTTQAKVPHRWEYTHDHIGYNYRMPNINAALGVAQIEQLDQFLNNKRELAQIYKDFFQKLDIDFFAERAEEESNYWLNAVILKDKSARDEFLLQTNDAGVMTRPIWTLMNKMPMFKNFPQGDLSNAEWLEDRVVNIPSSVR